MRRWWQRCRCDCHEPTLDLPGLGWSIVTVHSDETTHCCRRARMQLSANADLEARDE